MNFLKAVLAWAAIAFVLGLGLWLLTTKGTPWILILAVVGFVVAVGAVCSKTH
jgi:hypothetical protein